MRTKLWCAVAAAATLLGASAAHGGMMCGRAVVLPGATTREVLDKCGTPSRRQSVDGKPLAARRSRGKQGGAGREVWVYEFGGRQLVRYLTFERGRLRSIAFGGYGSAQPIG